jgi:outer membrane protein assembly factor BamB
MIWVAFTVGCATINLPKYNKGVIKKQSQKQPRPLWQYPSSSVLREVKPSAGLSGLVKPKPLPNFIPDVEPPFIVGMNVLSDGSLVCISPLELQYESAKFVFATYWREVITRVKIIVLNGKNGTERWSRVISASGVYDVMEIKSTLLFKSRKFDKDGKFVETKFVALKIENGDILWQRSFTKPFRYFSIAPKYNLFVFSMNVNGDSGTSRTVEAVDVSTGKPRWTFQVKAPTAEKSQRNVWPIIFGNGIMFFDEGVAFRRLTDGKVLWHRKDTDVQGIAQPEAAGKMICLQSKNGLVALNFASGRKLWMRAEIKDDVTKIAFTGKHLCIAQSKKEWLFKTHTLSLVDPASGRFLWKYKTEPVLGNIVESKDAIFFSTKDRVIALDVKKGAELFKKELPWDDEFSPHVVSLRNQSVTVKNEWNVAMWSQKDGKLVYHHNFEPLCPIMTTQERMLEQKELGAQVSAIHLGAVTYNSAATTAYYQSRFNQSMASYRSTGDSLYLSQSEAYYGLTRSSIAMERTLSDMQSWMQINMAIYQLGISAIHTKIITTHSMVYPAVDLVIKGFRSFDNGEYAVRLVGVQVGSQRFSAIEILHESTGKLKQILLSPYQMPSDLKTIGSNSLTAHELNGYLSVSIYLGHSFSTVVDLKRKCIFHYGPGLNVDDFVYFDKTGFVRGKLWMFPIDLPARN